MRKLVLWGHQLDEYKEMFSLQDSELQGRLLEYGCGPSAINATLKNEVQSIISVDPLFSLDAAKLHEDCETSFNKRIEQIIQDKEAFDFSYYGSLDDLIAYRRQGLARFFQDYPAGRDEKRYLSPKNLNFNDFSFDLALSSHYFFADAGENELALHLETISALANVAKEVRIFPLIDRFGQPSPLLGPVLLGLQQANLGVEICNVNYHLQPAGHAMLKVWAKQCEV